MSSCEPEQCIEREDYYLCSLPHEYNILPKAGSSLGHKHSNETKKILSEANTGEKNPMFGKTGENHPMFEKNHSDDSKKIMSDAKKGKPRPEGSGKPSQVIEVTDIKNNTTISYDSIHEAARALNCNESSIRSNIKSNSKKPYKGQYTFKRS